MNGSALAESQQIAKTGTVNKWVGPKNNSKWVITFSVAYPCI